MADVTDEQRKAANNQIELSKYNADSTRQQANRQIENYDSANKQNRRLADVQLAQNSRKTAADRFEAQRDLQNTALGLMGSMGNAMNGSATGNLMSMLNDRNDKDNQTYWSQHQVNQDAVQNAYNESANQNQIAKNDVAINAEKAIRDMQGDLAANLNNINPELFQSPGTGDSDLGAGGIYDEMKAIPNQAVLSGYLMPENAEFNARRISQRNALRDNDYFSKLVNYFNRR